MSSETTLDGASAPRAPDTGATERVLLTGKLHPAVLLLRLIDGIRNAIVPTILGIVANPVFLAVGIAAFLIHAGYGLLRYLTFHYTLTTDELRTREGVLHRQERRIPIDRIQDLGFESTILRRALGLAVVRVETASGQGVEAALDSLSRGDAERLRETLLMARGGRAIVAEDGEQSGIAIATAEPEWVVFVADAGTLLLRGLTDLRFGAMAVAAFGAYELADQLGLLAQLQGVGDSFYGWLRGFPWFVGAALLAGLVLAALAFSAATAAIGNVLAFHGFRLTLHKDALSCRYGLLTTRQKTLPRARIQRLRVEQTWLRRLLGFAVARAESAGAGRGVDDEAPGGFDLIVPLAKHGRVVAMLPAALPDLALGLGPEFKPSHLLATRLTLLGVVEACALGLLLYPAYGPLAALALLWAPIAWIRGRLLWHGLAFSLSAGCLRLRTGMLGSYEVLVPTAKVQAVALRRGPVQRLLGLAEIAIFVAGGPPTRVPDLDLATAQWLCEELGGWSVAAALREWRNPVV